MLDVCVVGHITRDLSSVDGRACLPRPGGTAHYAGIAYQAMGLSTAVVTRMRREDQEELLGGAGIRINCLASSQTTHFENIYFQSDRDLRQQRVRSVGDPFRVEDLADMKARVFHFGSLLRGDIPPDLLKAARERGALVVLDAQGLVRTLRGERVEQEEWSGFEQYLQWVDVLKADFREICILARISGLTGEQAINAALIEVASRGPSEILATAGSKGSRIHYRGRTINIPAFHPVRVVDTTGCGDTFTAGYVARRLQSGDVEESARHAAALAAIKLEAFGPVAESGPRLEEKIRAYLDLPEKLSDDAGSQESEQPKLNEKFLS